MIMINMKAPVTFRSFRLTTGIIAYLFKHVVIMYCDSYTFTLGFKRTSFRTSPVLSQILFTPLLLVRLVIPRIFMLPFSGTLSICHKVRSPRLTAEAPVFFRGAARCSQKLSSLLKLGAANAHKITYGLFGRLWKGSQNVLNDIIYRQPCTKTVIDNVRLL